MIGTLQIVGLAFCILLVAVYGIIYAFSHSPRESFKEELLYTTNDNDNIKYELPTRINGKSEFIDRGIEVTVVIPCYNETKRLGKMFEECIEYLVANYNDEFEILIIDDGSKDGTDKYAIKLANEYKLPPHTLKVVNLKENRGKGGAVAHGMLHSSGKLTLFADADGATSFKDSEKLIDVLNKSDSQDQNKAKVAIGSRAHMVNTDAVVKRSFIRNFLMYGLHTLVYVFGIKDVRDTQCGFKMFNFDAIKQIFPHMHNERWIFDVEILLLASIQNIPIKEIPVNWQEVDGSKIDLARDSIYMAIDLVVTRIAYLLNIYKLNENGRIAKKMD